MFTLSFEEEKKHHLYKHKLLQLNMLRYVQTSLYNHYDIKHKCLCVLFEPC